MIDQGDIIILSVMERSRPYNGEKWENGFMRYNRAFRVDSINNNGTIKAHDKTGRLCWTHESSVLRVIKK